MIGPLHSRRSIIVLWCALLWMLLPVPAVQASPEVPLVVIDPGHGGIDPGAVDEAAGVMEKTVNLAVGQKLARLLEDKGFRVAMTWYDDGVFCPAGGCDRHGLGLPERVAFANSRRADLFVSLHANSFWDKRCEGAEVFFCPESREGARLSEHLRRALGRQVFSHRCKCRPGDYFVLRQTDMPAVLVEMGYLSNPREGRMLQESRYQERLAEALAQAINAYFSESCKSVST